MKKLFCAQLMALAIASLAAMPLASRGEEVPAKPAPVARVSVASIDGAQKFLKELGLPLPVDVKGLVERQFPFIGKDGLSTDKPMGLVFNAGDEIADQQMVTFAFPVNEGVATVEKLVEQGMTASGTDMAGMGEDVSFKRTPNYLYMFAGGLDGVKDFADTVFAEDYKAKGTLAFLTVDLAALRKAAPKKYEAAMKQIAESGREPKNANEKAGYDMVVKTFQNIATKLERVTVSLSHAEETLTLKGFVSPVEVQTTRKLEAFSQPAFPEGTVIQMHVTYPNETMRKWASESLNKLDFAEMAKDGNVTPEEMEKAKSLMLRLSDLMLGADAQSIGLTANNGEMLGLVVNQYDRDVDFSKELKTLADEAVALQKEGKEKGPILDVTTLTGAKGGTITRVTMMDAGKPIAKIDCLQKGKSVFMTIGTKEVDVVEGFAGLAAAGQMKGLLTGSVDLAGVMMLDALKGKMAAEEAAKIREALAGKMVTWNVQSSADAKGLSASVSVPMAMLKASGQALMTRRAEPEQP